MSMRETEATRCTPEEITLEGAGALYERFLALKAELEEMGMFAPEYKQPIPRFIQKLGVVTAPSGAAVQDIRNISLRRNPYLQIILYPALVQGDGAAYSIVQGIRMLDGAGVDTIIVGRGGDPSKISGHSMKRRLQGQSSSAVPRSYLQLVMKRTLRLQILQQICVHRHHQQQLSLQ